MSTQLRERCRRSLSGTVGGMYSLPALAAQGFSNLSRLPRVLRIVLESLLRNCDGERVLESDVAALASWQPNAKRTSEIPFVVGRIVLQDIAGIPLLGDLAAMRDAIAARGGDPKVVKPRVPVAMVIDHSVSVDHYGTSEALIQNMRMEVQRNEERFSFVKWAVNSIEGIRLIPPGFGILHQVNLEHLAPGLLQNGNDYYPDTLVGTDSHTCMIAGLGVVGWGVGGIEAEAAMLGQPVGILTPDVVAVELRGRLAAGVTATDLVLHLTHALRKARVVGKFLEFIGDGTASLSVPDRATVANMAPEYGATIGFFPYDVQTSRYMLATGRSPEMVTKLETYWRQQECLIPATRADIDYSDVIAVDLADVEAIVAGPKRPQDIITLPRVGREFKRLLSTSRETGGYGKALVRDTAENSYVALATKTSIRDGDVVIAAITSCTNTSNPDVMLTAGLVARNAVARGMRLPKWVKPSLAPGSLVVTQYLRAAGLESALDTLGFDVVGYGCTTCVGNSGPLVDGIEEAIKEQSVVACAVLSGNRNFEGRIHPAVDAAFLMSPPLVVAYALAGTVDIDLANDSIGEGADGKKVFLRDLWPSAEQLDGARRSADNPDFYRAVYDDQLGEGNPTWNAIDAVSADRFPWKAESTYIRQPPYFTDPALQRSSLQDVTDARILAIFGDSVTTDHISPVGNIATASPAGAYLRALGVTPSNFNNYGARRLNPDVMTRGTFANRLVRNLMMGGREGGMTRHWPEGDETSIFDAAMRYAKDDTPVVVFAGEDYGMGSARDWAAKGTRLLSVRAVVAQSFERIHRSNLAGMGVLPCQLPAGVNVASLSLDGSERVTITGLHHAQPGQSLELRIERADGTHFFSPLVLRLDTPSEIAYAKCGGILHYVLDKL